MSAGGIPEPEFKERTGGVVVVFRFREPIGVLVPRSAIKKVTLSPKQEEIMEILKKNGSVSIQEIMAEMVNPPSQRMLQKYLEQLGLGEKHNQFVNSIKHG